MALVNLFSFDHVLTANLQQLPDVISVGSGCTIEPSGGRGGTGALSITDLLTSPGAGFNFAVPAGTAYIIGTWVVIEGTPGVDTSLIVFGNPAITSPAGNADKLITLSPQPDGSIKVWAGGPGTGSLLAVTPAGVLTYGLGQVHYIEMSVTTPGGATGNLFVAVDGVTYIFYGPGNTAPLGVNQTTHIMLGNPSGSPRTRYDDIYVANPTADGSVWTGLVGVIQVEGKLVNAAGEVTQWTPSAPTGVNYTNVNEPTPNSSTFNSSSTLNQIDLYNAEDVTYAPIGVQVDLLARKTGLGVSSINHVMRPIPAGANQVSANKPLATTARYYKQAYGLSNVGVPWTMALYNQAQFGMNKAE